MNLTRRIIRLALSVSVSALATLSVGVATAQTAGSPTTPATAAGAKPSAGADASKDMHSAMMGSMESMKNMPMTGDTDKDFATMMKMHHQQAIAMAKSEAEHGKSPELKAMARKMIKDQTKEIEQLDAWLKKHP